MHFFLCFSVCSVVEKSFESFVELGVTVRISVIVRLTPLTSVIRFPLSDYPIFRLKR